MRDTIQKKLFDSAVGGSNAKSSFNDIIAIGTVVDTNDPMQWSRLRVVVTTWGDSWEHDISNTPWAMYMTSFGGVTSVGTRGPGTKTSEGGIAYGQWMLPKVGAQVVVMSLDEEHQQRIVLGCIYDIHTTHTMPHGRWTYEDHPELDEKKTKYAPFGPFTSREKLIQPLANNIKKAFGDPNREKNFEWQTRAADYAVSRVDVSQLHNSSSKSQDDKQTKGADGWTNTQGYQLSRIDPRGHINPGTDKNYDPQTYCLTTPGFHSFSMDDRMENCRIRIRSTSGNQIILDDTNERIYISTCQGNNWIEMDRDGNIDMFSSNKVNIHSANEINMTSDESIRLYAKKGIHMHSDKEIRATAKEDIHVLTKKNIRVHAEESGYIQIDKPLYVKCGAEVYLEAKGATNIKTEDVFNLLADDIISIKTGKEIKLMSDDAMHLKTGDAMKLTSSSSMNIKSDSNVLITGSQIHLNGPSASTASEADKADESQDAKEKPALWTNRVPAHEPWARVMTKKDNTHEPEFKYDDENVNKKERDREIPRGLYWRR